jgi:hypothetical protein
VAESPRFVLESPSPAIRRGELREDVGLVRDTGEFIPLLETGWDVPCQVQVGFATQTLDQPCIVIAFHRRAPGPGDLRSLGEVAISLAELADPKEVAIDVVLGADEDTLWVSATSSPGGNSLPVVWSSHADA